MPSLFPAAFDALANPLATDSQLAVSHAHLHAEANDAIEAMQAKIGIDNSADPDSLDYLLRRLGVPTAGAGDEGVQHLPLGASAIAASVRNWLDGLLGEPVTNYATKATLEVDATAAVVLAIAACRTNGKNAVYFPPGIAYRFAAASASIDPGTTDITFYGDNSKLTYDEGTSTATIHSRKNLFQNVAAGPKGRVTFRNLHFHGTWQESGWGNMQGGAPIVLDNYTEIVLEGCRFTNLKSYVTVCEFIDTVRVIGCTFDTCARDCIRFRSSFNVRVIGNYLVHCDDDAIALHSNQNCTGGDIREGIVVADNILEDTSGIKILAGRMVTVRNNIFRRTKTFCIAVYSDAGSATEANSYMFGVDISGNQIFDHMADYPMSGPVAFVIGVFSRDAKGGTGTGGIIPGQPNPATGVFPKPWDSRNGLYSDAAAGVPALSALRICANTIKRTLPAVATYSSWGFGQTYAGDGPHDPAITDAVLQPGIGIYISAQVRGGIVSDNIVEHVGTCVSIDTAKDNFACDGLRITNNVFRDFSSEALGFATPGAVRYVNVVFAHNDIDGDPLHRSTNRKVSATTDGSWLADSFPQVVTATSVVGIRMDFNKIRNVCRMYNGPSVNTISARGNILRAKVVVANAFSTSNKGIGNCPLAGTSFDYETADCDPTSATYGNILNSTARDWSAMPSSGEWVAGQFAYASGDATKLGWKRITTGSGNVLATDWVAVAAP